MPRRPVIALLVVALLANTHPSLAQFGAPATPLETLNSCTSKRILQRGDFKLPMPIAAALSDSGAKIAISACGEFCGQNIHYFVRSLSRHQNGVCEAKETEVFLGGPEESLGIKISGEVSSATGMVILRNLTGAAPAAWTALGYMAKSGTVAFATEGNCPAMNDARYIGTANVPDEKLKQIQEFWLQSTASPESFDQALGGVPFEFGIFMPWIRLGQKALLDKFRERTMAGKEGLYDIACNENTCTASFGLSCNQFNCWLDRWIKFAIEPQGVGPVQWGGFLVS